MGKKKVFISLLFIFVLINIFIFYGNIKASDPELKNMELVSENKYLKLYINKEDTSFVVKDKKQKKVWFSNPPGRKEKNEFQFNKLSTQLNILYDPRNRKKGNYKYSNQYNQYDINSIDDGVRIDYTYVEDWNWKEYIPKILSEKRMNEFILNKIDEENEHEKLLSHYKLFKFVSIDEIDRLEIEEINQKEKFKDYTLVPINKDYQQFKKIKQQIHDINNKINSIDNNKEINRLKDEKNQLKEKMNKVLSNLNETRKDLVWDLIDFIIENRPDIDRVENLSFNHFSPFIETPTYIIEKIPAFTLEDLYNIIKKTDYNPLDASEDHRFYNIEPPVSNLEVFDVSIEYILEGNSLLVRIPCSEIQYPMGVKDFVGEKYDFPLTNIQILPNFFAANRENKGYIFVPDGSGALINLNNNKLKSAAYNEPVYGRDKALDPLTTKRGYSKQIYLPVFGLKKQDQAFLAIIEKGKSMAKIRAEVAGMNTDYNRVFAEFNTIPKGTIEYLGGEGSINVYQSEIYKGDIQLRYKFLSGDDANYSGMARSYQKYLVNNMNLSKLSSVNQLPFMVEFTGAITKLKNEFGFPRKVSYSLTSFKEAKNILEKLKNYGITNMDIHYKGFLRGGLEHYYPENANHENKLGSKKDLEDLHKYMENNKFNFYPEVDLLNIYHNKFFDHFNPKNDSSKLLSQNIAKKFQYDKVTFQRKENDFSYVLSPAKLPKLTNKFMKNYKEKYNFNSLSLKNLGNQVNSDFKDNAKKMINREDSMDINLKELKLITEKNNMKIMLEGTNSYTLPYASAIINLPLEDSYHSLTDQRVPFLQMVLNGYIKYTGKPINLIKNNRKDYKLLMIETGALPFYSLAYADSAETKNTDFENLYSLNYNNWLNEASDFYLKVNKDFADLYNKKIIEHKKIEKGVYKTIYENKKFVLVNYNDHSVNIDGIDIEKKGYTIRRYNSDN
ncbi:MAG: DUF5696 domain-containing protein [archaeon]